MIFKVSIRPKFSLSAKFFGVLLLLISCSIHSQEKYPERTVRIIAPQTPGGGVDVVARIIADQLRLSMGQSFVVYNEAGAGGSIAAKMTARSAADGYTLMIGYVATNRTTPAVKKDIYDPIKDFTPIAMLAGTPNVLVVHKSLPVNNVKEFISYAIANPTEVDYGTSGLGTLNHLLIEQFKRSGVSLLARESPNITLVTKHCLGERASPWRSQSWSYFYAAPTPAT